MEIKLNIEGENAVKDAEELKKFLENRNAAGLNEIELTRTVHKEGEQGFGKLLGGLILKLTGSDEVIKGAISLVNKFAEQRDKRIHLGNGIIIPPNTMTPEQILEMVSLLKKQQ